MLAEHTNIKPSNCEAKVDREWLHNGWWFAITIKVASFNLSSHLLGNSCLLATVVEDGHEYLTTSCTKLADNGFLSWLEQTDIT